MTRTKFVYQYVPAVQQRARRPFLWTKVFIMIKNKLNVELSIMRKNIYLQIINFYYILSHLDVTNIFHTKLGKYVENILVKIKINRNIF